MIVLGGPKASFWCYHWWETLTDINEAVNFGSIGFTIRPHPKNRRLVKKYRRTFQGTDVRGELKLMLVYDKWP